MGYKMSQREVNKSVEKIERKSREKETYIKRIHIPRTPLSKSQESCYVVSHDGRHEVAATTCSTLVIHFRWNSKKSPEGRRRRPKREERGER
jgi:hypothetical protein